MGVWYNKATSAIEVMQRDNGISRVGINHPARTNIVDEHGVRLDSTKKRGHEGPLSICSLSAKLGQARRRRATALIMARPASSIA
ncbi:hypothetical protein SAMN05216315_13235 [Nitrosospira sp. Nsp18]|nr:hypothetical protein SAMN05216315_13235 [Nitrosospira sp. Nsp18]